VSNALEHDSPVAALAATSIGFAMMCVGMFMAILDVQVVATARE
jgi:MFS transporter, DHA2 family, multidrug resistance protein